MVVSTGLFRCFSPKRIGEIIKFDQKFRANHSWERQKWPSTSFFLAGFFLEKKMLRVKPWANEVFMTSLEARFFLPRKPCVVVHQPRVGEENQRGWEGNFHPQKADVWYVCGVECHPRKLRCNPKNGGLEDVFSFQIAGFQVKCWFWGEYFYWCEVRRSLINSCLYEWTPMKNGIFCESTGNPQISDVFPELSSLGLAKISGKKVTKRAEQSCRGWCLSYVLGCPPPRNCGKWRFRLGSRSVASCQRGGPAWMWRLVLSNSTPLPITAACSGVEGSTAAKKDGNSLEVQQFAPENRPKLPKRKPDHLPLPSFFRGELC